jgi:hypothetical protein
MRRSWSVGSELHAIPLQGLLEHHPEKFGTTICLNTLDRKWKLFDHTLLQEVNRVGGGTPRIQPQYAKTSAIVDSGVLEAAGADFHRIDLHAISWQWTTVPSWALRWAPTDQGSSFMGMEDLPDRGRG